MLTAALLAVHVIRNEIEGFGKCWVNRLSQTIQPGSFLSASPFSGMLTGTMFFGKDRSPGHGKDGVSPSPAFFNLSFRPCRSRRKEAHQILPDCEFFRSSARTTTAWDGINISPGGCAGRGPLGGRYFRRAGHCRRPVAIPRALPDYPRFSKAVVRCSRG